MTLRLILTCLTDSNFRNRIRRTSWQCKHYKIQRGPDLSAKWRYWPLYSSIVFILTECLDNSGLIFIWDMSLRAPFQRIDASSAGSVTSVCWISLQKNITSGEDDPAPAFAVGFGTGTIAIYKQTSESVSASGRYSFTLLIFLGLVSIWIHQEHWSPWWASWGHRLRLVLFEDR